MRYLVTGGLGFIGSEVCRQLLADPNTSHVQVLDDDSKGYGTRNIADFMKDPRFDWRKFDLTREFLGLTAIYDMVHYADIVINCAAKIGGIGYFNKIPAQILRNNNLIVSNVLDAIVAMGSKARRPRFVYMSSSMVFENAEKFPSAEADLPSTVIPESAYGFSKLSGEFYCTAFAQEYDIEYTIVRPFNAVGPEKPDPNFVGYSHVLPDFVMKILQGQGTEADNRLKILGSGKQVRHYTDVREIAKGIIMAAQAESGRNNDFNIAISKGHTVDEVAHLVWNHLHPFEGQPYIEYEDPFPCDVQYRSPCIEKARDVLGYEAQITLEDNIGDVVQSVLDLINGD
jgi:nucleoside-diphosphate-sugar epimerase